MKKENKFMEFLNSKGFYTALFTCLFAVLAIAAFVSIRNIDSITKLTTYGEKDVSFEDELRPAAVQDDIPISELARDSDRAKTEPQRTSPEGNQDKTAPDNTVKTQTTPAPAPKPEQAAPSSGSRQSTIWEGSPLNEQAKQEKPAEQKEEAKPESSAESVTEIKTEEKPNAEAQTSIEAPTGESAEATEVAEDFSESEMDWPLDGAIVMEYSMEHGIFDKTLEQYRTNPTVSISSEPGTQVKAAADGVVKSVSIDPRMGYTLVIDHGNGWQTTYGQLQETILVKEGDSVAKGQAVGGVGTPTKYGVLYGTHLVFGVTKDGTPQNPKVVLAE